MNAAEQSSEQVATGLTAWVTGVHGSQAPQESILPINPSEDGQPVASAQPREIDGIITDGHVKLLLCWGAERNGLP